MTKNSAAGGLATNATTLISGITHASQPFDTNVVREIVNLLSESIPQSGEFAFFPPNRTLNLTNGLVSPGISAVGNWLQLSGLTNGQVVTAGQSFTVTASASDGRLLNSARFVSPSGSAFDPAVPYQFSFSVPQDFVGLWTITAAARDTNGQMATAAITLSVTNNATLQSIEVDPPQLLLTASAPFQLRVWGAYSDGIRRDITLRSAGTRYGTSDRFQVSVTTNGVVTGKVQSTLSPVTVSITNGVVFTNVLVTVNLVDLPPEAVVTVDRTTGPAPLSVRFFGENSWYLNPGSLTYFWDFGDGSFSTDRNPLLHWLWRAGDNPITLTVTDGVTGLVGTKVYHVFVEPHLVVDGISAEVPRTNLAYLDGVITNGGILSCARLGRIDLVFSNTLTVASNSVIDATGKGYPGGAADLAPGGGPGGGHGRSWNYGSGASYGGIGGIEFGTPETFRAASYGSFSVPADFGSGGGDGYKTPGADGGGWINIQAQTLQVNGVISADSQTNQYYNGGGSGGSVQLMVGSMKGNGVIRANGGSVNGGSYNDTSSGAGGGGRVAVYYDDLTGFSGMIQAKGGINAPKGPGQSGGAGTVYLRKNGQSLGELVIDNGGTATADWSTPLRNQGALLLLTWRIDGQARVSAPFPVRVSLGDPDYFLSLINSNYLQVGSLWIDGQWSTEI